jgi:hypothetical protein
VTSTSRTSSANGFEKVHPLQALGRDGEGGRGDVALAGHEPRQQLVARDRDHDDVERDDLVAELLVELLLELLHGIVGDPDLAPAIHEIENRVLDRQHANQAPLEHPVQVALERLEQGSESLRQRRRLRSRLQAVVVACVVAAGWAKRLPSPARPSRQLICGALVASAGRSRGQDQDEQAGESSRVLHGSPKVSRRVRDVKSH